MGHGEASMGQCQDDLTQMFASFLICKAIKVPKAKIISPVAKWLFVFNHLI